MTTRTNFRGTPAPSMAANLNARAAQLTELCLSTASDQGDSWMDSIAEFLADAAYEADLESLTATVDGARWAEKQGSITPAVEVLGLLALALTRRFSSVDVLEEIGVGTVAERMLLTIHAREQIANSDLVDALHIDDTSVSRTAAKLNTAGLLLRAKVGKNVIWSLSPKGQAVATRLVAKDRFTQVGRPVTGPLIPLSDEVMLPLRAIHAEHPNSMDLLIGEIPSLPIDTQGLFLSFSCAMLEHNGGRIALTSDKDRLEGFRV